MTVQTVYGDSEPADALGRLCRQLDRLRGAIRFDDMQDHAIEFCGTAWNLREWAWKRLCRDAQFKAKISRASGISPSAVGVEAFGRWIDAQIGGRLYHVCQIVATEAKHTKSDRFELEDVAVYVSSHMPDTEYVMNVAAAIDRQLIDFAEAFARPAPSSRPQVATLREMIDVGDVFTEREPVSRLKVRVDGTRYGAIEAFEIVLRFWEQFLAATNVPAEIAP